MSTHKKWGGGREGGGGRTIKPKLTQMLGHRGKKEEDEEDISIQSFKNSDFSTHMYLYIYIQHIGSHRNHFAIVFVLVT